MSDKLNRLARVKGDKCNWTSYGSVGHIEAARMHAERSWEGKSLFSSLMGVDAELYIEVRCSTDDTNANPHCFKMKRRVVWDCLNPRQGADDPKHEVKKFKIEVDETIDDSVRKTLQDKQVATSRLNPCDEYKKWPQGWRDELEYQNPISGGYPKTVDLRVRNDYEWAANTLMNGLRDLIDFWHKGGLVESWERDEIGQHYYALVRNMKRVHEKMNWDSAVRVIADLAVTGRKETTGALSLWLFWQSGPYKQKESGVSIAREVASARLQETNNRLDELKSRFQQLTNPNGPGIAKVQIQLPPKVPLRSKRDYVSIKYSTNSVDGEMTVPRAKFNGQRFNVTDSKSNKLAVITGDEDGNVVCTFPANVEGFEIRVSQ
jgi:hypothetical protein